MKETKTPAPSDFKLPDPVKLMQNLAQVFARASEIAKQVAARPDLQKVENDAQILPMEQVAKTLGALTTYYMGDQNKLMQAQMKLWQGYSTLWQGAWAKALGHPTEPMLVPSRSDKRFKDKDWQDNAVFDFLKQAYLISSKWAIEMVNDAELDEHTKLKAKFYVEQIANAVSPSNFVFSNPEVLKATLASNGANLISGMDKLERDLASPDGRLRIKQTDTEAFEVGRNIALTPGKVVFRNDVFELIHYAPSTTETYEYPLLIAPPWINKFYILDLTPQKSYIKWCVDNGITVFVMSWVNASDAQGRKSFSDYMRQGFLTAIDEVQKATGSPKVNSVGFCIGGTMVAASLGYMAAKGDTRVNAATFFTTQVDFEKAGDLCVYVDEEQVKWIEGRMEDKGYLPGSRMADAFNLLRANDLIWSNVINNYLLGKDPMPFDLLFWNADSTRMPAGVHSFYLRECYMNNKLSKGTMVLDNVRIDLSNVKIPIYNLAAREDHIAPLPSVFKLGHYMGGTTKLVVSGSGHIAGVVNPPDAGKYQYWTNDKATETLEDWLADATETPGSWWTDWLAWISTKSGRKIAAKAPVDAGLGDAPGEYVRVKGE
jgi:polyhydroxyalkanoate synthase subunit PhaC